MPVRCDQPRCSSETRRPILLLLKGPPGSGKSTLAAALAAALRWPLVDKDDARSSFQPLVGTHPGIDWNELSYAVMWRVAATQLACGLSVVVDCPLARRSLYDRAAALVAEHGAQLALVELEPRDAAEWRRRVKARGAADAGTDHAHKPGSWADIQAVAARNGGSEAWSEALGLHELPLRLKLDSTAPGGTAAQLAAVLAMLRRGGAAVPEEVEQRSRGSILLGAAAQAAVQDALAAGGGTTG
ncbi:hypothetical protein ABPG75_006517 [Micractinium tetrahymenae]